MVIAELLLQDVWNWTSAAFLTGGVVGFTAGIYWRGVWRRWLRWKRGS